MKADAAHPAAPLLTAPPRPLIAAVFRVRMTAAWAAVLLAGLAAPALFAWLGVGWTIVAMGLATAAAAAIGWVVLRDA